MRLKTRKPRRSDFADALEALSTVVRKWSEENAPRAKVSKGRISQITPRDIEISFWVEIGARTGTIFLKGPQEDFKSALVSQHYLKQLIEKFDFQLGRAHAHQHYIDHYKTLAEYQFRTGREEFVPGQTPNLCRFCEKGYPDVTFKRRAHAVAEMFGNRTLLTKVECDDCNSYFGNTIEHDLANHTHAARTSSHTKGKRGAIPRDEGDGWSIEVIDGVTVITMDEESEIWSLSEDEKTATSVIPGKELTPIGALKALTKFALCLMDDKEFAYYKDVARWVRQSDHTISIDGICPIVFESFFQESHRTGCATLLQRKSSNLQLPYMSFGLIFGNHYYQSFLPAIPDFQAKKVQLMPNSLVGPFQPKNICAINLGETKRRLMPPTTMQAEITGEIKRDNQRTTESADNEKENGVKAGSTDGVV
ncbi:MAG: HNH endonuclease [Candidatus Obscuribacterales bacterium]|nr:HNH endonuclease [Candidatus Obscuribacterales bacterium]